MVPLEERAPFQVVILPQAALHSGHTDSVVLDIDVCAVDDEFHEPQGTT